MEATALPASVGLGRSRVVIGASLLRIRSDEQLVTLFRAGHDDAFRVIHDRYRPRLYAYTRQMLNGTGQDPEDAVQEIFMRAYYGLRANERELALRAWLYRIAHNRCVDELRRPHPIAVEVIDGMVTTLQDPVVKAEQRDALRRLIADVQRLPEQQRSALLMRELSGMPYNHVADAMGVSVSAVKSLLVRARVSLAQASEARDTACTEIREDLIDAHDRGVRTSGLARRHMRDCHDCREFRTQVRGVTRGLAALTPTLGPLGVIANLLGWGSGASGSAVASGAGGGAAAAGGAAGGGAAASAGLLAGGTHVVTLLAAAVVTAGGAVELQNSLASPPAHRAHHRAAAVAPAAARRSPHQTAVKSASTSTTRHAAKHAVKTHAAAGATTRRAAGTTAAAKHSSTATQATNASATTTSSRQRIPITETLDPDNLVYPTNAASTGVPESDNTTAGSSTSTPGSVTSSGSPASTQNAGATTTMSGTPIATPTGSPSTTTTGTGSESGTATGTPAATGTGTGSNTGTSTGTVTPSTTPTTTGTSNDTSSTSTAGTQTSATSVGTTTTRAGKGKAIRLISKRHHRHARRVVGGLISSIG